MKKSEALELIWEILELKDSLNYENDREERKEIRKMISKSNNDLRNFLAENNFEDADWNDSKETMIACGLSDNQAEFIMVAESQGMDIISYSGRGMYGDYCPAVVGDRFNFSGKMLTDSMGLETVFYARY